MQSVTKFLRDKLKLKINQQERSGPALEEKVPWLFADSREGKPGASGAEISRTVPGQAAGTVPEGRGHNLGTFGNKAGQFRTDRFGQPSPRCLERECNDSKPQTSTVLVVRSTIEGELFLPIYLVAIRKAVTLVGCFTKNPDHTGLPYENSAH
jgi:hypothetical protein